ncbi:mitochondrial LYR family protein Cup1 [Schizosaccharomyces osmophilus]|uniref:Mitochondrial LYR family protein Cup1 n=1 Tax=Schizosaccharomyces osmophilus TaxID=2545709 RepID=A0AAE9W648_9SCHI|nr:mitochondrial LYR family protein Cup1 [Schizosaccharomyces osmophilus]WBW70815.1 mitochondrial LYR family protein Cup1 [Schizosaccharomyces osmophilus]
MPLYRYVQRPKRLDRNTRIWLANARPGGEKPKRLERRLRRKLKYTPAFPRTKKRFPLHPRTRVNLCIAQKRDKHFLSNIFQTHIDFGSPFRSPLPITLKRVAVFPRYRTLLCLLRSFWDPLAAKILSDYFRSYARKFRIKHRVATPQQQAEITNQLKEWINLVERANKGDQRYIFEILAKVYSQDGPLRQRRLQYLQNAGPPLPPQDHLPSHIDPFKLPYISPLLQIVFQLNKNHDVITKTPAEHFQAHFEKYTYQAKTAIKACHKSYNHVLPRIALPLLPHEHAHLHQLMFDAWTRNPSVFSNYYVANFHEKRKRTVYRRIQRCILHFLASVCYFPYKPSPVAEPMVLWESLDDIKLKFRLKQLLPRDRDPPSSPIDSLLDG